MNLFGELEEGIDYIMRTEPIGRRRRYHRYICTNCGAITFKRKRSNRKNYYCNQSCYHQHTVVTFTGSNNPNWRGGSTSILELRRSHEYSEWRDTILARDNYTCQDCEIIGVRLEVHHIYPVSMYPVNMFDIENGITLCVDCHHRTRGRELELIEGYLLKI